MIQRQRAYSTIQHQLLERYVSLQRQLVENVPIQLQLLKYELTLLERYAPEQRRCWKGMYLYSFSHWKCM